MTKFKLISRSRKDKSTQFTGISPARRYVRRAAVVFMAVGILLTSTVITSSPALAYPDIPSDMNRNKYPSGSVCVGSTLNSTSYPVGAIAQQWNVAVPPLALSFHATCTGVGSKMTVGVFNNPSYNSCLAFTNTETFPVLDETSQMNYWQYGVGVYINVGIPGCVSTAQRRGHQIAAGIGYALGLKILTTSGYANRVMCTCSLDTLRAPDSTSASRVWEIYIGKYGG